MPPSAPYRGASLIAFHQASVEFFVAHIECHQQVLDLLYIMVLNRQNKLQQFAKLAFMTDQGIYDIVVEPDGSGEITQLMLAHLFVDGENPDEICHLPEMGRFLHRCCQLLHKDGTLDTMPDDMARMRLRFFCHLIVARVVYQLQPMPLVQSFF